MVGADRSAKIVKVCSGVSKKSDSCQASKLGLVGEPDAVAYENIITVESSGGVSVVYVAESDDKAWVKYLPHVDFDGAAIAGIPTEVSRAMLWGWYANNGVL